MSMETSAWGADFSRRRIVAARPGSIAFQPCGSKHAVLYNFHIQDEGGLPCLSHAGVIWNRDPLKPPVIPAKAGIQSDDSTFPKVCRVDYRFRGND